MPSTGPLLHESPRRVLATICSLHRLDAKPRKTTIPSLPEVEIRLVVRRGGKIAFEGTTTLAQMARTPESLVEWLGRENEFPNGVLLLTGTGIVPPDEFNLTSGDVVDISIAGIGTLSNPVA